MRNSDSTNIKPWMYRVTGESSALFLGIVLVVLASIFVTFINYYLLFGLVIYGIILVALEQSQHLGSSVRVYEKQFPEIYEVFKSYAYRLGISKAALYIKNDPYLNAYTIGVDKCTVVLNSALVEQLEFDELCFVIGHELSHYQAGHTKLSMLIGQINSNNIFSGFFFGLWQRKGEYTCDRGALILTKNIDAAISSMVKLSIGSKLYKKLDMDAYAHQIKVAGSKSVSGSELLLSHPVTTNRIRNLIAFWNKNFITAKAEE